jgi:uncharacterized membrane protein
MKKKRLTIFDYVVLAVLILLPIVLVIKFIPGFDLPYLSFKNKPLMYSLVALWNMSVGYFLFKIV